MARPDISWGAAAPWYRLLKRLIGTVLISVRIVQVCDDFEPLNLAAKERKEPKMNSILCALRTAVLENPSFSEGFLDVAGLRVV